MKKIIHMCVIAFIFLIKGAVAMTNNNSFALSSPGFSHQSNIPSHYTCEGGDHQPALKWTNPPEGTKSFTLIMDDPDAPRGTWVHWIVFNIPASITEIEEDTKSFSHGEKQGMNSWEENNIEGGKRGNIKYGGPCPPFGKHRYVFTLYALDCELALSDGAKKADIIKAMEGHIIGKAQLIASYEMTQSHSHHTKT